MSGPLAIAAASASLRELLQVGMTTMHLGDALGGEVTVSVGAPDRVVREGQGAISQLNLFLYNVNRNPGYANHGLPARDGRGERISNPILGLDLYYLLTAYAVSDFDAEILLGGAIQVLHDTPALGREAIREALTPSPTRPHVPPQLQEAGLADQIEIVKISPVPMPSDEISRLWSSLQTPYRPSVAYVLSVVLLEAQHSTRTALPARDRTVRLVPFRELRIDRVVSAAGMNAPINTASTIRVLGRQLGAPDLRVLINGIDVTAGVVSRSNEEIRLSLQQAQPDSAPAALPAGLKAGPCGVQLMQPISIGLPAAPHEGFVSNVATFVLSPQISVVAAGDGVDVTCTPPVGANQRVRLLLNQSDAPPGVLPRSYSFAAPTGNGVVAPNTEATVVHIAMTNVASGRYLVRLQVDGAQSELRLGAGGVFAEPGLTL